MSFRSAKNFLTFGWHSEEDGRVDYVYYRPPIVSGGHEEEQLEARDLCWLTPTHCRVVLNDSTRTLNMWLLLRS